ncbi:MAG: hypothetical protein AAFR42_01535 [Cyanobacteria bacterium J06628_6]
MTAAPDYMKRFLLWVAIASPLTLVILLSLMPADLLMLWLYGSALALCYLTLLMFIAIQVCRSQAGAYWKSLGKRVTLAFFLVVSVIVFNWPMRTAFLLSRPTLDQAAQQLLAGEVISTPRRMGFFRIAAAELLPSRNGSEQVPALWTDLGSGGDTMGFVQSGASKPPFIMWSHMRLDENWQFIYRAE